ncbi:hypothetical protein ACFV9C_12095 [Kribbella sp. NPDC059898]|uniref:hypothetical protein n=1 Tax=Kribbella sp. NPDC059898 TaxID=3346995 RepID=UPI00365E2311
MRLVRWSLSALVVVLAGCSAIPQPDKVRSLTRPAITDESAHALIKHYNDVNNAANRTRDDALIATVEGGNLLRESQAGFTVDRATDKTNKKPYTPFFFTIASTGTPSYGSYPMRFVTKASVSTTKDYVQLGVWQRDRAGAPWLHTFTTWVPKAAKIPDLAQMHEISSTDATRWAAGPGTVANELASYLTVGAKSPYAGRFAPSEPVSRLLTELAEGKSMAVKQPKQYRSVSNTLSVTDPPVSFATTSGDALVFATLNDEYKVEIGSDYKVAWTDPELNAFSPATDYYENALTNVTLHDVVLAIPPKGTGKVRVLSLDSQLIDAGGY